MNYKSFMELSITEKRHHIENYIDCLKSHLDIEIEESRDLDDIKLDLISALSEAEYNDLINRLEKVVLSYKEA